VRRAAGVPVTHHAAPRPDLELLAAVAGLLGNRRTRPPVVPVAGGGQQPDDLDDVQRGLAQDEGPALSISP
jgi:hypothetical protein